MIIFKFIICFFSCLFYCSKSGTIHLNSSPQINLSYSFPKTDTIRFTLESNTQGYVGIGFGTQMAGTNIFIGYNLNGEFVMKDTTSSGHTAPVDHAIQNIALISASRDLSKTIFVFERLLKTNDSNDYTIVPFSSTPLIWAYGSSDSLVFHVNYGSTYVVFEKCDSSCLTCSGSSASECLSCNSGKTLLNKQCIFACDSSCFTCSGNSSSNCTSCDSSHQLIYKTCIALNCNSSCLSCSGPSDQNCTSCANGKYLLNNQCLSCQSSCLTCSGGSYSECLSCPHNSYINNDSSCVLNFSQCPLDNGSSCFSVQLNSNPLIYLNWSFPFKESIKITMEFHTEGYIALGFGMNMSIADVILANLTDGQIFLKDLTSLGHSSPKVHVIQDSVLLSGIRANEKTIIAFQRKLNTNSVNKTVIVPLKTTPLIWAYGSSDTLSYHGKTKRGMSFVSFIQCHSSCKTCSGPESNACIDCQINDTLFNGQCLSRQCHHSCKLCQGPTDHDCVQCDENTKTLNQGSCIEKNALWETSWNNININNDPMIRLNYSFISTEVLSISIEFHTLGYIAIGFGYNMSNADIIIAYQNDSKFSIHDTSSKKYGEPDDDESQDAILQYGFRDSLKTFVNFQRKLNTTDSNDHIIIPNATVPFIWAYGNNDELAYHGSNRSQTLIAFQQTSIGKTCYKSCQNCYGPYENNCLSCFSLYFLQNNECILCDNSCLNCFGSGPHQCKSCENQTHVLINGTCCPIDCSTCSNNECLSCIANFTLINGQCSSTETKKVSSIKLNENPLIYLNYSFPQTETIEMIMEFHTLGYISIGFGTKMNDSDMIISYMLNNQFLLKSMTATGHVVPTENSGQNLTIISSFRDTEKTVVTFLRKLSYKRILAGTPLYTITPNNDTSIIWAYGSNDILKRHVQRGSQVVQFQYIVCDSSCLTCTGSNSNQCSSCPSSYQLNNGSCIKSSCDNSCLTCSGSSNNQCTSCQGKYILENGMCLLSSEILNDMTSELKITDQFYMYWKFNSNNTVTIALRWNTEGYLALGFGKSMDKMDIISAEYLNSILSIYDRWSNSENRPSLDSEVGGKNDLTLLGFLNSDSQGYAIVKFIRALNTGDEFDYIIQQKNETFCLAFSDQKTLSYHGSNLQIFSFNFVEGFKGQAVREENGKSNLIKAHAFGLLIIWSFLVDISLIIVRYFKNIKKYIDIHASIFLIVDIFTLIIVFIVIGKNGDSLEFKFKNHQTITAHFAVGVIVLNLIVFQHIFGFIMKKTLESKNFNFLTSKLSQIKKIHRIIGYTIYLLTKASVLTGIWIYDYIELFIGFAVYFGILFIFRLIMELIYQKYFTKNILDIKSPIKLKKEFQGLLNDLGTHSIPMSRLAKKYPHLKWCMLNNSIYDLKDFNHPGGKYIIEQINGREIGRFFFGAYALEHTNSKPHFHSEYAKNILRNRHIGEFKLEDYNIFQNMYLIKSIPFKLLLIHRPSQQIAAKWTINNKVKFTDSISKIEFSCPLYAIKNHVKGVQWFGRHFTVCCPNSRNKKVRLYTTVLCFTDANIIFRNSLIDFFEQKMGKSIDDNSKTIEDIPLISPTLPLIIKRYDFPETLSGFIHYSNHQNFDIDGPHGPGLEMNKNSNGNHIIFCGGTGILPFIDLLDFLLRKSIYHVLLTMMSKKVAEKTNYFKEDYEDIFGSKFKVYLYAAFQTKEEFESFGFILTLFNINKKYNLNYFDMILRFNDSAELPGVKIVNSYFDDDFFSSNVVADQCSKVFICGNPKLNKLIPEICLRNQIEKDKIYLV